MNVTLVVSSLYLALGFLLEMNAHAAADTEVKGTIKVAGAKSKPPSASPITKCGDLEVVVTSKAAQACKKPVCLITVPVWQRHQNATGDWSSGLCSYAVTVVAESEFNAGVWPSGNAPVTCSGYNYLTTTPPESGWLKVSSGDTKEQNFTLDSTGCQLVP